MSGQSLFVHDEESPISGLALDTYTADADSADGHSLYACTRDGGIFHLDTRCKDAKTASLTAHEKKVTAISLQAGGVHIATSSADATIKVFDARKFPRHVPSGARGSGKSANALVTLQHSMSVTSTGWSPSGRFILGVCNDNKVRAWEAPAGKEGIFGVPDEELTYAVNHNNHTGRWLSPFKASWDPSAEATIVIGNMDHTIDLFAVKGAGDELAAGTSKSKHGSLRLAGSIQPGDYVTAVTTQTAVHPTLDIALGGTASGRVYLYI